MTGQLTASAVDRDALRRFVTEKYTEVANEPEKGFHFHNGRPLAEMLGYDLTEVDKLPPANVESFAGTGNPFSMGKLHPGETVVDIGCGAGLDALLAARQVGPSGRVIAIDMTDAMLAKTRHGATTLALDNVDARRGYAEELPVADASIDVVISNGVFNLTPDKLRTLREVHRVLKPGGRLQIGDIVIHTELSQDAKDDIDLWAG
jgi:SAM-dependent methyltransferase